MKWRVIDRQTDNIMYMHKLARRVEERGEKRREEENDVMRMRMR